MLSSSRKRKEETGMEGKRWEGKSSLGRGGKRKKGKRQDHGTLCEDGLELHSPSSAEQEGQLLLRMEVWLPSRAAGQTMTSSSKLSK